MKTTLFAPLLAFLLLGSCQTTQQSLTQGMTRSGLAFSYADLSTPGGDTTQTNLAVSTGSFFEANQEIGVKVNYDDLNAGTASNSEWMLALYGRYYMATRDVLLPWFELDLGWADNDVASDFAWGMGVGMTQFITQGGAVEASLEYQDTLGDAATSGFRVLIGYSLFF
jgi:hypothetical protein